MICHVQNFIEDLPDAICFLGKDLRIGLANSTFAQLAGRPTSKLIGADYREAVPEAWGDWIITALESLSPEEPIFTSRIERDGIAGGLDASELRARAIFDDEGRTVEYQIFERLIDEQDGTDQETTAVSAADTGSGNESHLECQACKDVEVLQSGLHILNCAFSIEALYEGILSVLTKIVPFSDAAILMLTKDGGLETVVNHAGKLDLQLAAPEGVFMKALEGEGTLATDLSRLPGWNRASIGSASEFASGLIVPLEAVNQSAVIVCVHSDPAAFTTSHLRALKTFAPIASQAVQWTKQRQAMERHQDHLEELVRDRTRELGEQKERLAQSLEKELELSGLQRQFVSMVCHEFRTPLAIIDGNAQRVQRRHDKMTPERLLDSIDKIRKSVVRLTDLIESVLDASRIEAGRLNIDLQPCNLSGMIEEVCSNHRDLNPGYRLVTELESLPDDISADIKLMRQVFSNLISNAVKYSPEGTHVWVEGALCDDDLIEISVRDDGVGIPASELGKLFDRFFRASTSTGIVGTGIGLHLARTLVEMHGGAIDVESEEGKGTTFTISLPRFAAPGLSLERSLVTETAA